MSAMGFSQQQRAQTRQAFGMKLAGMLEMPEKDCAALIREMEADPPFVKLAYPSDKGRRAVKYKPFRQTALSYRFFELNEDISAGSGTQSSDLATYLAGKEKIIKLAQTIGEEKFKNLFLYAENEMSLEDISEECGLTVKQTREIMDLVNMAGIFDEFSQGTQAPAENAIAYSRIGSLVKNSLGGYDILFTATHWARGVYDIDYDRLEKLKKEKLLSAEERKKLPDLVKKLELVNSRKSTIYRIISSVLDKQKPYLDSRGKKGPVPYLQNELAEALGMHPSSISRAVSRKTLETPWGEEKFLKDFFFAERMEYKVRDHISEILGKEKSRLKAGTLRIPLGDKDISDELKREYKQNVAPRTVAKYRVRMGVPNSYRRNAF